MDYIKLKTNYPKSTRRFFEWLSNNQSKGGYVDNAYFRSFFGGVFRVVRSNSGDFVFWLIEIPEQVNILKIIFPEKYNENDQDLTFLIENEDDFDVLFKCMEILISKKIL
ncbi:hypothetical protein [Flavobacterium sp. DSP2-3-1]|uniref:hypothetical protein n=1 Tax=Flavobacterium sp. DSP2-3-1 TaxID=2804620 RepID=UPI003CF0F2D6